MLTADDIWARGRHKALFGRTSFTVERGEARKVEAMEARVKFDLFYMQNWSFWFDMKIILLTVVRGFIGRNAF